MFSKFSNKKLTITFITLLIFVAAVIIIDQTGTESTFDQDIVSIDSSKVTRIILYPKSQRHKEVKLIKQNNKWQVQIASDKFKPVPKEKIMELITSAMKIEPIRLAAKTEKRWKEYEVDTSGTRVEFYEGNDKTLDIVIGKFTFQQPRNMTTFVRLTNDKNVYAVEGFLEFVFNKPAGSFRNESLINLHSDELRKVTLNYKSDSSFVLEKVNNKWLINNQQTDSAKTAEYIRALTNLISSEFADNFQPSTPSGALTIETVDKKFYTLTFYPGNLITSSQNRDEVFYGTKFVQQLIKNPADFM